MSDGESIAGASGPLYISYYEATVLRRGAQG